MIVACVIVDSLYAIIVDIAVVWGCSGVHSWVVVGPSWGVCFGCFC